jgi:DNA-directed RNA polymerase specialized sigma24 family protein
VTALYKQHYVSLVRLAALLTDGTVTTAEQVVRESFVALRHARRGRGGDVTLLHLRRSVVYRSRSALRGQRVGNGPGPPADSLGEHQTVVSALRALPTQQREVLILRYYADLSDAEIAQVMAISTGAVRRHTARATASLRQALDGVAE